MAEPSATKRSRPRYAMFLGVGLALVILVGLAFASLGPLQQSGAANTTTPMPIQPGSAPVAAAALAPSVFDETAEIATDRLNSAWPDSNHYGQFTPSPYNRPGDQAYCISDDLCIYLSSRPGGNVAMVALMGNGSTGEAYLHAQALLLGMAEPGVLGIHGAIPRVLAVTKAALDDQASHTAQVGATCVQVQRAGDALVTGLERRAC